MTSFELKIAIAIGVMIGELVKFFIVDGITSVRKAHAAKMFEKAMKELENNIEKADEDEKNVDNNPFE